MKPPLAPLAALFALAVMATAWVASTRICAHPIAMQMDNAMLPMPAHGAVMLCPVVVGLIVLSTLLSAWALVTGWRDRHRALTLTVITRVLARLPMMQTFAALAAAGGIAIGTIVAVDGGSAIDPSLCALLASILAASSLIATFGAVLIARVVLAFCARILLALARAIGERRAVARAIRRRRALPHRFYSITFGRDLRAPPPPAH